MPLDWTDARTALEGSDDFPDSPGSPESTGGSRAARAVDGREGPLELLEDLNEPQQEAVRHGEGPLLILAGAGSGKTRVITRRIAWLIGSGRAAPHEILAITFTNKAAREMRERVQALLSSPGMWISTFHSMCARILRRDIEALGGWTRDFSIYDTHDRNSLLKRIVKDLGYDTQRFRPGMVGAWISDWKNQVHVPDPSAEGGEGGVGMEDEVLVKVRERYDRALRENNALDFDDLLLKVLELFDSHPGIRDGYAHRFRYVLVDEYQDTNRVQYRLTRHLSRVHGNLAVCGDPDQSIYGWRGADIRNILDFEEDFGPGGHSVDGRAVLVTKLEQNYRSTPTILKAAQALIRNNVGRKEKDLWSARDAGDKVRVTACSDENDEANEIANQIHAARARGYQPDQIAIFYRVNFMQRALERGLRMAGIPYQIVGGVEFYQRREVRDLISYLQLLVNPRDDVACARVLNVPARGIGDKSVALLAQYAAEERVPLLEACRADAARARLRGRAKAGVAAFAELIDRLSAAGDGAAAVALDQVIEEVDYFGWLTAGGDPEAVAREENVEELQTSAETWDRENPEGGLRGFLQEVALVSDVDGWDPDGPRVTLMTLHSSKGLEFPVVFLAGMEEELLPHALALRDASEDDEGVEEERRLCYVGMTRAQDLLHLTYANTRFHYGETSWRQPSRFLEELPAELVEGLEPEEDEDEVLGAFEPPADSQALSLGDRVEHDHFGHGVVERLQGAGANARVTVDFSSVGTKVLLVAYAKLRVVR